MTVALRLARARQVLKRTSFDTTAQIMRKTTVADGMGGQVDTYVSTGTYPCTLNRYMIRPLEREQTPLIYSRSDWEILFEVTTDVQQTDRIVCNGRTFEVLGRGVASFDVAHHVLCLEIL